MSNNNDPYRRAPRSVPPPQGTPRSPQPSYARIIPREELGDFANWSLNGFAGAAPQGNAARPEPEPAAPTADELQAQLQAARQQGYQDGYQDGLVALDSFKQSFAKQMAAQVGQLLASFDSQLTQMEQEMAQALARTATLLARQVVRSELQQRPELVAQVAEEAVNAVLMSARHIRVQVNPQDQALVAEGAAEALAARGARLMANAAVQRGGCLIESDAGCIDARVELRWQRAAQSLGQDVAWTATDEEPVA
jgi:flagellar assembly protein FliH